MSRGSSPRTAATLSRTSCAFSWMSYSSSNSTNSSDSESLDALRRRADALDGVDRLLEHLRHLALDGLRRGALQHRGDGDDGELDAREEVEPQARNGDRRRARTRPPISITANTGRRMEVSGSLMRPSSGGATRTRMPGAMAARGVADDRPRRPTPTPREHLGGVLRDDARPRPARPPRGRRARQQTRVRPSSVRTASRGTSSASGLARGRISTWANTPGLERVVGVRDRHLDQVGAGGGIDGVADRRDRGLGSAAVPRRGPAPRRRPAPAPAGSPGIAARASSSPVSCRTMTMVCGCTRAVVPSSARRAAIEPAYGARTMRALEVVTRQRHAPRCACRSRARATASEVVEALDLLLRDDVAGAAECARAPSSASIWPRSRRRQIEPGLGPAQRHLVGRGVDLEERRAGLHPIALGDKDAHDAPLHLGPDLTLAARLERSRGADLLRDRRAMSRGSLDVDDGLDRFARHRGDGRRFTRAGEPGNCRETGESETGSHSAKRAARQDTTTTAAFRGASPHLPVAHRGPRFSRAPDKGSARSVPQGAGGSRFAPATPSTRL